MLPVEHIKRLRRLDNITQQQIADVIGVTKNYISQLESGKFSLSEEFYDKWIKAIHLLSSMKHEERVKYIKNLKENLNEEIDKSNLKGNKTTSEKNK